MVADLVPTEVERRLIEAVANGASCDLTTGDMAVDDSARGAEWGPDRTIRADVLHDLMMRVRDDWPVHDHGVLLEGARIEGDLDLAFSTISVPLALMGCYLPGEINLLGARTALIALEGTWFAGLSAQSAVMGGTFRVRNSKCYGTLSLDGGEIAGHLDCDGSLFENPNGDAITADNLRVSGNVLLRGASILGEVRMLGARIGGNLELDAASLRNPEGLAFDGEAMVVARGLFWRLLAHSPEGNVDLARASAGWLVDDLASWPESPYGLLLDGFEYGALIGSDVPLDSASRIRWLSLQPSTSFWPQPFEQLAVLPIEVVYRREAGVAPAMPPCGRR